MITGQHLADLLPGFQLMVSQDPPPGAAYEQAVGNLPAPTHIAHVSPTSNFGKAFRGPTLGG